MSPRALSSEDPTFGPFHSEVWPLVLCLTLFNVFLLKISRKAGVWVSPPSAVGTR